MHLSNILTLLFAYLISANPILVPSLTVSTAGSVSGSIAISVPTGHPSTLTASVLSVLQALAVPTGPTTVPEIVSVSIESVGPIPTLGLPAITGPPPFSIPLPVMDEMPTAPPGVDSFGLPIVTFPATPTGLPVFYIPTNKMENVPSASLASFGIPSPSANSSTAGSQALSNDLPSVGVPSVNVPPPSLNIPKPTIGIPFLSVPPLALPSLAIPSPSLNISAPTVPSAEIPAPTGLNGSASSRQSTINPSAIAVPTAPTATFLLSSLSTPSLSAPTPSIPAPTLSISAPFPPKSPTLTIPTNVIPTLTLATTIPPASTPTYDPVALLTNATKAIEVLEILIDIAKADAGVNAVTMPGSGLGLGNNNALVRTLLEAFFPLFSGLFSDFFDTQ